ncbi:hypothetical protein [Candidatus Endomicrobiellum agilis]|uniref:hypothetical protein n=1 Tax=Candidatus Endomicrobiellum agilis TaxID=3238957 RepID=UPI0035816F2B|nr:hypothetical protein [Endomicrobium sp.]
MSSKITLNKQIQTIKPAINPSSKPPLFCFRGIAKDKNSRKRLKNDKTICKDFLDSIMTISELETIEKIKKHKGLNFEPLEKPTHSVRATDEYRILLDFEDMKFSLKSIKHKNEYKKNGIV